MQKRMILMTVLLVMAQMLIAGVVKTKVMPATYATGIGNTDAPILYIMVEVDGKDAAAPIEGIKFTLKGTTQIKDVTSVKFYQTLNDFGLHLKDAERKLLGTYKVNKNLSQNDEIVMDFQGLKGELHEGKNYFWLTADVSKKAAEGHFINASLISYFSGNDKREYAFDSQEIDGHPFTGSQIFLTESTLAGIWSEHSHYWRIPAIATGRNGRLIAVMDKRWDSNYDLPNNIDVATCYSDDGGRTWSPLQTIAGTLQLGGDYGHGDPGIIYNKRTGDLMVIVVSKNGFLPSTPDERALIKLIVSHDNGETWDEPRDITDQIYGTGCADPVRAKWRGAFAASGAMMQTQSGRIMTVLCVIEDEKKQITNYVMYSDDDGQNWTVCPSRVATQGDESKVVELSDGRISVSVRHRGGRFFNVATVDQNGELHFGEQTLCEDLMEPACNGDYIRYSTNKIGVDQKLLLHTICHHPSDRRNVSVFLSEDDGQTWLKHVRPICPGRSGYSALTVLKDGTIGCFFEEDAPSEKGYIGYNLRFVRFSMNWLTGGKGKK
ncbi:MAG: exo-alpha-sialidase [Bacteroidaceae bacterium]|nr:exo-alpha-sialidase [Bacteroidaceae bacterium]